MNETTHEVPFVEPATHDDHAEPIPAPATLLDPKPKRDALGAYPGSVSYRINAALTTEPQTAEAIAAEVGDEVTPARVRAHFRFWIGKGKPLFANEAGYGLSVAG